ncbi:amidase [Colwellia sp. MEBiC06753]
MNIDIDLLQLDLTAQIALVKNHEISYIELCQQQQQLIALMQPKLNCFIQSYDQYAEPNLVTSPLAGLPIAVKDNIDVVGFNTTAGLGHLKQNSATSDAFIVKQLKASGATINGKLNMHEGALGATNHNPHFGDCHNPHQLGFTPGGSSGGSGAAVAACLTPVALGTDTMGSVRIPAAYNGIFGFKASPGAISNQGSITCSRLMDHIGPLARSARDLKLLFPLIAAFNRLDASSHQYQYSVPKPSYRLLVPSNLAELGVEASIIKSFEQNIAAFTELGHQIEYTDAFVDYDFAACRRAGLLLCEADMLVEHQHAWLNHREQFSDYLTAMFNFIETKSASDIMKAERLLDQAKLKARQIFASTNADMLLLPTTAQRAFSLTDKVPANQADLTSFANQAGLAAISIPMVEKIEDAPLPAGMQIMAKAGDDIALLQLACDWQQASQYQFQLPKTVKQVV